MLNRSSPLQHLLSAFVGAACFALSSAAPAHTVEMNLFDAECFNEAGAPSFFSNSGAGNNPFVRWGGDTGSGQSGYNLDLAPPPPVPIIAIVPPNTSPFLIGSFTHVNQPVTDNSITGIDLRISFDIVIDGSSIGVKDFSSTSPTTRCPTARFPGSTISSQ